MSENTPNLVLPFIMPSQAQKHVTHNEAIRALDALVQIGVASRDLSQPPETPENGARFIVGPTPGGDWTGRAGRLAAWQDGAWAFFEPRAGWIAWVEDEARAVVWRGGSWEPLGGAVSLDPLPLLGVNASADETNRLAVSAASTLLSHEGAGHRLKVNKAAPPDTASLLFQTAFSGRAEMGLAGGDDFRIKVSADGESWKDALVVDRATGAVSLPNTAGGSGAGPLTVSMPPLDASGAASTVLVDLTMTEAQVNEAGGDDRVSFRLAASTGRWDNGPVDHASYYGSVMGLGFNLSSNFAQADAAKPAGSFRMESKYFQNGVFAAEYHLAHKTRPEDEHRMFSWFAPFADADGTKASASFSASMFSFLDWTNIERMAVDFNANRFRLAGGLCQVFEHNNAPVTRQHDADGATAVALPYVDDGGNIVATRPLTTPQTPGSSAASGPTLRTRGANTAALTVEAPSGDAAGITLACGTTQGAGSAAIPVSADGTTGVGMAAGAVGEADIGRTISGPGVPGGTRIVDIAGPTRFVTSRALPASVSAVTLGARTRRSASLEIDSGGALAIRNTSGAIYYDFNGSAFWRDTNAGYATRISLDASRLEVGVPLKLPSVTLTALPSAAAAGAGALVYVSDASGGPTLACSDGAAWRAVATLGAAVA
ncbi:MAG: DUF2793 domain-containing protein [Methylobacterium mesophilicum]|nr:DUF2793 domain-containing protein [Methylobacterium mesophilicum]